MTGPSLPNIASMVRSPMTRIARAVVPGLPHHVTSAATGGSASSSRLATTLSIATGLGNRTPFRRRGLGLLPDAEPRPSDPDAAGRRGFGAGAGAGA